MEPYPTHPFEDSRTGFEGIVEQLCSDAVGLLEHDDVEEVVRCGCKVLMQLLLQDHFELRTAREVAEHAPMRGSDGELRTEFRSSSRTLGSLFGDVRVRRLALVKHGVSGGLHPMDARLNLPVGRYSLGVRREVAWGVAQNSYDHTVAELRRTTGSTIAKRQAEDLAIRASSDFEAYYEGLPVHTEPSGHLLILTFDGKGVPMRPEGLRQATRDKAERAKAAGRGRRHPPSATLKRKKNRKRMAEVGAVYALAPMSRTADDVMRELDHSGPRKVRPKPVNKRVWASLERSAREVVEGGFAEACGRDPQRQRRWVALVDANPDQLQALEDGGWNYDVEVTIIIDFIHVLEYLWAAGKALHGPEEPDAVQSWVAQRTRRLLEGASSGVAAGMRRSATLRKLTDTRRQKVDTCADYLLNHKQYLRYHEYLRDGLPIATGVIEGACRSLVRDRMDITGARWGLAGAEAVLKLRSLRASGDFEDYWRFHKARELERNHLVKYDVAELADLREAS